MEIQKYFKITILSKQKIDHLMIMSASESRCQVRSNSYVT